MQQTAQRRINPIALFKKQNIMGNTLTHESTSDQFTVCDVIPDLATTNFTLPNDQFFNVDNENDAAVILSVKFAGMSTFVSKKFNPGPNAYLIKEIEANAVLTAPELSNLKYGY